MKKAFLLFSAVFVAGLVIGCVQPAMDITHNVPSSPSVSGEDIKYTVYNGFNLVTFSAAEDSIGYSFYRRILDAEGKVVAGTNCPLEYGYSSTPGGTMWFADISQCQQVKGGWTRGE